MFPSIFALWSSTKPCGRYTTTINHQNLSFMRYADGTTRSNGFGHGRHADAQWPPCFADWTDITLTARAIVWVKMVLWFLLSSESGKCATATATSRRKDAHSCAAHLSADSWLRWGPYVFVIAWASQTADHVVGNYGVENTMDRLCRQKKS